MGIGLQLVFATGVTSEAGKTLHPAGSPLSKLSSKTADEDLIKVDSSEKLQS